ncbi:hypothetical protein J1N35_008356 [Gossypium stocksii]|uniref:Uncharacterized protein n=1 Tax=Gossypium stocksii TaxID=47602 RepID=A0A9D3WA79_9ROSI|nr:hypothetical protein J1N35_008356 [Gossypium stocksii]
MVRTIGGDRSGGNGRGWLDCGIWRIMRLALRWRPKAIIIPPNPIMEGARRLSDVEEGFILPLHVLKKPRSWSSKSTGIQEGSTITPINIVGADNRLVDNTSIAQTVEESRPSESTSLSREIDNVQSAPSRVSTREGSGNNRKRKRTIVGSTDIVLNSEDEDMLEVCELYEKKGKDHAAPLTTMTTAVVTYAPSVSFLPVRPPTGGTFGVREYIYPSASSSSTKRPSLKDLILSLQVALTKIEVNNFGLLKSMEEEEIKNKEFENSVQSIQGSLEEDRKLYKKLEKDNRRLVERNEGIDKRLMLLEKESMEAIVEKHKIDTANLEKCHEEALAKYQAGTMQKFQDYMPDLKSNILLHT